MLNINLRRFFLNLQGRNYNLLVKPPPLPHLETLVKLFTISVSECIQRCHTNWGHYKYTLYRALTCNAGINTLHFYERRHKLNLNQYLKKAFWFLEEQIEMVNHGTFQITQNNRRQQHKRPLTRHISGF